LLATCPIRATLLKGRGAKLKGLRPFYRAMTAWLTKQVYLYPYREIDCASILFREVPLMNRSERRKLRKKKIGILPLVLILTLSVILASAILFLTDSLGFATTLRELIANGDQEIIDENGFRVIDGDYTIDAPGTKLEDAHIYGNLYLSANIGNGSVDLINLIVDGSVLVQGGGMDTIYLRNCNINEVKVYRPEGPVRLVASGDTTVARVILETGARLVENLAPGFKGFRAVEVVTGEQVALVGSFNSVHILIRDANVEIESDALEQLVIVKAAGGSAFKYPDGMSITKMYLDGTAYLIGRGDVDEAYLSASGITELAGNYNLVRVTAEAGHFDLRQGSVFKELIVARDAFNNTLNLDEEVTISYLELNEAVEVTGKGKIEKVLINAPGSTIEQVPLEIELAEGITVIIAGFEISSPAMLQALRKHGDPHYAAKAAASTPVAAPAPAPKPAPDPAPALEPEPEPEPAPDPIKNFIVEDGLTPGKKMVIVTLSAPDPENYTVKVGGTVLGYNAGAKSFWGEVDNDDAFRSKVAISRQ